MGEVSLFGSGRDKPVGELMTDYEQVDTLRQKTYRSFGNLVKPTLRPGERLLLHALISFYADFKERNQ